MSTFNEIVNESLSEILNEGYINEDGVRQFVSPNNLFDALSTMKGNVRVCVGYMTVAKLKVPQVQRINPATKRKKNYDDWETFGKEIGVEGQIASVVKLSKYHRFNYLTPDDLKDKYKQYRDDKDAIKLRYGLNATNKDSKAGKFATKQEYGDNGIEVYSGTNDEKIGNSYVSQNVHGAEIKSVYYLLDADGNEITHMEQKELLNYLKPYSNADVAALQKLGKDENEIKQFLDEIGALKMQYQKFENSKILYIAAKSKAYGKFTYINTNLSDTIDGVKINPQLFIKIAAENYKIDIDNLD